MDRWRHLEIQEHFEDDRMVRLSLNGELDLASVQSFASRLGELRRGGYDVRLDLAGLEFMDSTGLGQLINEITQSRANGWRLEISRELAEPVARLIELTGTSQLFWPEGP